MKVVEAVEDMEKNNELLRDKEFIQEVAVAIQSIWNHIKTTGDYFEFWDPKGKDNLGIQLLKGSADLESDEALLYAYSLGVKASRCLIEINFNLCFVRNNKKDTKLLKEIHTASKMFKSEAKEPGSFSQVNTSKVRRKVLDEAIKDFLIEGSEGMNQKESLIYAHKKGMNSERKWLLWFFGINFFGIMQDIEHDYEVSYDIKALIAEMKAFLDPIDEELGIETEVIMEEDK